MDNNMANNIDIERILELVAARHGVSAGEVRQEMAAALELAQQKPDKTLAEAALQERSGLTAGADLEDVLRGLAEIAGEGGLTEEE